MWKKYPDNGGVFNERNGIVLTVAHYERAYAITKYLDLVRGRQAKIDKKNLWKSWGPLYKPQNEKEIAALELLMKGKSKAAVRRELETNGEIKRMISEREMAVLETRVRRVMWESRPRKERVQTIDLAWKIAAKDKVEWCVLPYWKNHKQLEMKLA